MAVLDLVPFYPTVLQRRLVGVRSWWSASSGDPYYGSVPHEPWLASFMYIEVLAQLPLTLYLVYRLSRLRLNTTGPTELAAVAYGCLTCMGSLACCFDIWHMGPDRVSDKQKWQLLWGTYLPFVVIRMSALSLPCQQMVWSHVRLLMRVWAV